VDSQGAHTSRLPRTNLEEGSKGTYCCLTTASPAGNASNTHRAVVKQHNHPHKGVLQRNANWDSKVQLVRDAKQHIEAVQTGQHVKSGASCSGYCHLMSTYHVLKRKTLMTEGNRMYKHSISSTAISLTRTEQVRRDTKTNSLTH
jgi:hypothetical protein